MPEQLIRKARPSDGPAIARLHLASYRAAYRDLLPPAFLAGLTLPARELRWRASLRDPSRSTFVTMGHNANAAGLTGFAEIGAARDDDAGAADGELIALHVAPAQWRRGIGRALHGQAIRALADRGCGAATLWVLAGNQRARAFYAAMGWAPDGRTRHLAANGITIPEVRYRIRPG